MNLYFHFSWVYIFICITDHVVCPFLETASGFPKWLHLYTFPLAVCENSNFSILVNIAIVCLLALKIVAYFTFESSFWV